MNRPQAARRPVTVPAGETSMRILEYGIGFVAAAAAFVLGFLR